MQAKIGCNPPRTRHLDAMDDTGTPQPAPQDPSQTEAAAAKPAAPKLPKEIGGAPGPEPTRYGDWQHKGRVSDF
jgi:hypothetical protein